MNIVGMLTIKNEAKFFLKRVIEDLKTYTNEIVIIDDNSEDNSVELAESLGAKVFKNPGPGFRENGKMIRDFAISKAMEFKPDWILALDADEILEDEFKKDLPNILNSDCRYVNFHVAHMWDEENYFQYVRTKACRRFFKVYPGLNLEVPNMIVHVASYPSEVKLGPKEFEYPKNYLIKHYGFVFKEARDKRIAANRIACEKNKAGNSSSFLKSIENLENKIPELKALKELPMQRN